MPKKTAPQSNVVIGDVVLYPDYRVATHFYQPYSNRAHNYIPWYAFVAVGPNPFGPHGGHNGQLTDGGWVVKSKSHPYDRRYGPYIDALADLLRQAIAKAPENGLTVNWEKLKEEAWARRHEWSRLRAASQSQERQDDGLSR